jgi:CMP-N,N'-diacetyllegionaminic acid synthase
MLAAFIPARSGSKRIPGKNIRPFCGHPLLAYAIQGAIDAGIFDGGVYVSTDGEKTARVAAHYGAGVIKRPPEYALDTSPDAEWLLHALDAVKVARYAILRPTSPFRTGATIQRAFLAWDGRSHMKAVEPVIQHPGKMWAIRGAYMFALWRDGGHLCQTNTLQPLHVQNASLEFRVTDLMDTYQPFLTEGHEGFDINVETDFMLADLLVAKGLVQLPEIKTCSYTAQKM